MIGLEEILKTTKGSCCVGDEITIADVFLIAQVENVRRYKVEVERYSRIHEITSRLQDVPEIKASHPLN